MQSISWWKKGILALLLFFLLDFSLGWMAQNLRKPDPQVPPFILHEKVQPTALNPTYSHFDGVFGNHLNPYTRATNGQEVFSEATLLICCYGGSSTYCINLEEQQSWPSKLESILRAKGYPAEVHNHGIPGHGLSDNLNNKINYNCAGKDYKQVIEIHYHGWNDFRMINVPNLDNHNYEEVEQWHFKTNRMVTGLHQIQPDAIAYNYLYMNIISEETARRIDFVERNTIFLSALLMQIHSFSHDRLISEEIQQRAFKHKGITDEFEKQLLSRIEAEQHRLLKTNKEVVFIPQLMNFQMIEEKEESFKYWIPGITEQKTIEYCEELSRRTTKDFPAKCYITFEKTMWREEHFLDSGHFSEKGSEQFAQLTANHIINESLYREP